MSTRPRRPDLPEPWPTGISGGALHVPARPMWRCKRCGEESPCSTQRQELLLGYQGMRASLSIHLGMMFIDCMGDLYTCLPAGGAPTPGELYERWFGLLAELKTDGPPPMWKPQADPDEW
ncbi:hypothetical protein BDK92_5012 [Micromonospora pisi]|uniref:Uncharacterized protein n=1 Tax=Micromonospora pisi TaxID=589240 RepID=A0A495JQI8_9ACTN|nr:hypothetical protein [Micromonospora pisi]RKR90634.1 hypothetical protein BDK92_5012 [Micromonospora pisi]